MSATQGSGGRFATNARIRSSARDTLRVIRFRARRVDLRAWIEAQLQAEEQARTAFFLLPIGLMTGILAVLGFGWRPSAPLWLPAAFALLALALALRCRFAFSAALILPSFALLGASLSVLELARTDTVIFSGEATTRIEARVLWRDRDERGRYRYLVRVERTERPVLSRPPQRIKLLVSTKHAPIPLGARYRGLVRLRAPSGPAFPGGYDFALGSFFDRVGAHGFALGAPDPVGDEEATAPLSNAERLVALRLRISDRIRDGIGGAEGAVASAIVTGERTGIPDDVEHWLRVTGLSHVLSISGLHMALVAGFAMVLMRAIFAAVPMLALHLPAKKLAAFAALVISAFYLALSGFDVATTRSFVMIAIMLVAVIVDRSALTLRNVAIAALIVLATTPHALMTASFQMSFAATAAIVAAYGAFAKWRRSDDGERKRGWLAASGVFLLGIAASSLVAGLATAPYAAFHFQQAAPFGLIANVLTLPVFSFWIMPLALIAMLAMPFGLDAAFLWLLGKGLTLVFAVARFLAAYLPDTPTGLVDVAGLSFLTLALLTACLLSSRLRFVAVPLALIGLLLAPNRADRPELLVFEDGRDIAMIDPDGRLTPMKERPSDFVFDQWRRAYPAKIGPSSQQRKAFTCETIEEATPSASTRPQPQTSGIERPAAKKPRQLRFCRGTTRSGMRVVWTDDYRLLGKACDEADVAIVARAVRQTSCRSGATLATLRTLRASGSLAVTRSTETKKPVVAISVDPAGEEWNAHRLAPWPETWRRPREQVAGPVSPPAPMLSPGR